MTDFTDTATMTPLATPATLRDVTLTNEQLSLLMDLVSFYSAGEHDHDTLQGALEALADNRPHFQDDVYPSLSHGDLTVEVLPGEHGALIGVEPVGLVLTDSAAVRLGQRLTLEGWPSFTGKNAPSLGGGGQR